MLVTSFSSLWQHRCVAFRSSENHLATSKYNAGYKPAL